MYGYLEEALYWIGRAASIVLSLVLAWVGLVYIATHISSDIARLILDYLRVFLWPAVVLVGIIVFKSDIKNLFPRLRGFESLFGKAKFDATPLQPREPEEMEAEISPEDIGNDFSVILNEKEAEIAHLQSGTSELQRKLAQSQLEIEFERIYNYIYPSQIILLRDFCGYPEVDYAYLVQYFEQIRKTVAPLLDELNPYTYVRFLNENGLIEVRTPDGEASRFSITPKGRAFLSYVDARSYRKPGNL